MAKYSTNLLSVGDIIIVPVPIFIVATTTFIIILVMMTTIILATSIIIISLLMGINLLIVTIRAKSSNKSLMSRSSFGRLKFQLFLIKS